MRASVLIAGIGNIFNRDDGFGVAVASKLARMSLPGNVHARDFGIRGFDLVLELLKGYDFTIFVDVVSRGGEPGTLYTIEPELTDAPDAIVENAHSLDPVNVLASARSLGASIGHIVVVGCEPATLEDDTGRIGLTDPVEAAVDPAIEMIRSLIENFNNRGAASAVQSGKV